VQTTVPILLVLLFLMGIGPLLPWRRASGAQVRSRLAVPAVAGGATVVVLAAVGMRNLGAVLAFGLAAFVLASNGSELVRGVRAGARARHTRPAIRAVPAVIGRNRRLYGGLIVHIGIAVAAIAITASSSFARQTEVTLARGDRATFAGYTFTYERQRVVQQPQRQVLIADVSVARDGRDEGRLIPSLNLYPAASEPIGTPSIRYGVFRDLYASVLGFEGDGQRATFRFFLNPGVTWLWVGGAIVALGGLLAAWPGPRHRAARAPRRATPRAMAEAPA
jgi:cytochrome c-type biogenesis protein CcmF